MAYDRIRRRVIVAGRVQGVFFRGSTQERARELGLDGWVRNRPDGTVEAVFEGEEPMVAKALVFCRQGPRWAQVTDLEVYEERPEGLKGFDVRS
jgi:acylphosphatase